MKDRKLYILLILLFPVTLTFGQNEVNRVLTSDLKQYNVFTANILIGKLQTNVLSISYERTVHKHFSVLAYFERGTLLSGVYETYNYAADTSEIQLYRIKSTDIVLESRYYPFKKRTAPAGFFVGGFFRYYFLKEIYTDIVNLLSFPAATTLHSSKISTPGHAFNAGIVAGYKFLFGPFVIEPLAGIALSSVFWKKPNQRDQIDYFTPEKFPLGSVRLEIRAGFMFPRFRK